VVGSDSLLNEVELLRLINDVFNRLGIRVIIKINNRKILSGIAELIGAPEKIVEITVAIDKIDKIGLDGVTAELAERGLSAEAIATLTPIITLQGSTAERLEALSSILADSPNGLLGVEELREILTTLDACGVEANIELDVSLARGLNYYTGTIIEVKAADVAIGSITGGGRYDNLTGVFGMPGLSGVGISFGADRIYDVLTQLNLFPDSTLASTQVMFVNFGARESIEAMRIMDTLRSHGIACELYPDQAKMKKQMGRADALHIPFVAIIGADEIAQGKLTLKNMSTGEQNLLTIPEAIATIQSVK
ncbi:MAG: ATP phosphoribosyltransferase regulatory subunit, partial [Paramuribaculum sp.]|nr:ATP phosphoribosyltransferase regulatory subunit [Paramuribaculum sp.]